MSLGRPSNGGKISGISAILLFVFTFFPWFGTKDSGELRLFSVSRNAWEALDYIPIVLLITIIVSLAVVALRLTNTDLRLPIPFNAVVVILGMVSVLLILFRIVDPPNFGSFREIWGNITIEGTLQLWIFLALLAAFGVAFGGLLAMWEEGISPFGLRARKYQEQGRLRSGA